MNKNKGILKRHGTSTVVQTRCSGRSAARQAIPCSSTGMESPMGHSSSWHCPAIKPLAMALHSSKLPLPTTVPAGAARLYPTGRHGSRAPLPEHPKEKAFGKQESMVASEQNEGIIRHLGLSQWQLHAALGISLWPVTLVLHSCEVHAWNDAEGLHDRQHCTSGYVLSSWAIQILLAEPFDPTCVRWSGGGSLQHLADCCSGG